MNDSCLSSKAVDSLFLDAYDIIFSTIPSPVEIFLRCSFILVAPIICVKTFGTRSTLGERVFLIPIIENDKLSPVRLCG